MRPGGGKQKGGDFERFMARELSRWWTKGERDDIFWRSHNSGAMGTRSKFKNESGDIMSINKLGMSFTNKFNIECRHSKGVRAMDLVYGNEVSGIQVFLKQGVKHAQEAGGKKLFGLMKEDRHPILVLMEYDDRIPEELVKALFNSRWIVMFWDEFKKKVRPEMFV